MEIREKYKCIQQIIAEVVSKIVPKKAKIECSLDKEFLTLTNPCRGHCNIHLIWILNPFYE